MAGLAVGLLAAGSATAIGYMQYAAVAYAVGSAIGSAITAKGTKTEGARLSDLKVTISSYGSVVPNLYGTIRTNANMIWSSGIREVRHKKKVGGKGGLMGGKSTNTTYTYSLSCAYLLAGNEITAVRRIWSNGDLVYDASETNSGVTTSLISNSIKIYLGTEEQMPDPTIQAIEGADETEAFRGCAYIVFDNLQLAQFGNAIPNFTFEIVGLGGERSFSLTSTEQLPIAGSIGGTFLDEENQKFFVDFGQNDRSYAITDLYSSTTIIKSFPFSFAQGVSYNQRMCKIGPYFIIPGPSYTVILDSNMNFLNKINNTEFEIYDPSFADIRTVVYNPLDFLVYTFGFKNNTLCVGQINTFVPGVLTKNYFDYTDMSQFDIRDEYLSFNETKNKANKSSGVVAYEDKFYFYSTNPNPESSVTTFYSVDLYTKNVSFFARIEGFSANDLYGGIFHVDEVAETILISGTDNNLDSLYKGCVKKINLKTAEVSTFAISTVLPLYTFTDGSAFNIANNRQIVFACQTSGQFVNINVNPDNFEDYVLYRVDAGQTLGFGYYYSYYNNEQQSFINFSDETSKISKLITDRYSKTGVILSNVITELCKKSGLTDNDIDVTQLSDITMRGYVTSNDSTLRGIVEQLSVPFNFNVVESDYKLKFLKNKTNIVKVINSKEMGAVDYSPSVSFENDLTTVRTLEQDLPKILNVSYIDTDDDYNQNTQQASRENVTTKTVTNVEIAVALSADESKNIAQRLLYDAYIQRSSYSFTLNYDHLDLEAGDTIQVADGESLYTMKISKIEIDGGLIKIDAISYNSYTYDQYAVGGNSNAQRKKLNIISRSNSILLDIPLLTNDDFVGFYAGSEPSAPSIKWNGSTLYSSTDDSEFSEKNSFFETTITGYTKNALGNYLDGNTFDSFNSIVIVTNEELNSATQEQVLNGANTALVGKELIQFMNAELIDANTYELSGLLRARYSTEQYLSNHLVSEMFVLLDTDTIQIIKQSNISINTSMFYKNVSFGRSLNDTASVNFINTANVQKPLAVDNIQASRNNIGDLNVNWIPRLRGLAYLQDYSDAKDFDEGQGYEIDILDNTMTVIRTIKTLNVYFDYTSAMQIEDFGSNQSTVNAKIFKLNENVGRGTERLIAV